MLQFTDSVKCIVCILIIIGYLVYYLKIRLFVRIEAIYFMKIASILLCPSDMSHFILKRKLVEFLLHFLVAYLRVIHLMNFISHSIKVQEIA